MPRAILALRRYPATMLLAAFLFAASLILAAASMGTVSGGGEGDDGGSGIGGTGKSGEFGGSGFGGTGGPSPFFTSAAPTDAQPAADSQDATPQLAETPSLEESVLIELSGSLETNALAEPEQADDVAITPASVQPNVLINVAQAPALERPATPELVVADAPKPLTVAAEAHPTPEQVATTTTASESELEPGNDTQFTPVVQAVQSLTTDAGGRVETASVKAESVAVAQESKEEVPAEPLDRASVPERIQRPDLPPFQRIRPVERPSLLPSRMQPMRI
jgi:hypothetical protein